MGRNFCWAYRGRMASSKRRPALGMCQADHRSRPETGGPSAQQRPHVVLIAARKLTIQNQESRIIASTIRRRSYGTGVGWREIFVITEQDMMTFWCAFAGIFSRKGVCVFLPSLLTRREAL
jgi:hypothetical protein